MKFCIHLSTRIQDKRNELPLINLMTDLALKADAGGKFSAISLTEHHLHENQAYQNSLLFACALAPRLTRATLILATVNPAMHHPVRLVESCNLIDQLNAGRLVVVFGPGFKETDLVAFGRPVAERNALFAVIALGEGVVGTVAAMSAVVEQQGWTLDAALVSIAGTGLTFGIWWVYYMLPSAQVLHAHRERSFVWGYAQMVIVTSIVATGAGLHVAALFLEGKAHIGPLATLLTTAIPVGIFLGSMYALYYYLVRRFELLYVGLLSGTAAVVALAVIAALSGVDMALCLVILMLAPAVTVVGYELAGYRRQAEALGSQGATVR